MLALNFSAAVAALQNETPSTVGFTLPPMQQSMPVKWATPLPIAAAGCITVSVSVVNDSEEETPASAQQAGSSVQPNSSVLVGSLCQSVVFVEGVGLVVALKKLYILKRD